MTPAQVTPNRQNYVAIGKIKENLVTEVVFPCPDLGDGTGTYTVVFQRPKEREPYPVVSRTEWPNIIWEVGAADTAKPGTGKAEVRWYGDGDKVGKSKTYVVTVTDGLADPTEAPEAYAGYVAQVARNAEAAKSAASGAETSAGKAEAALKALEDGIASGDFRGEKGEKGDTGPQGPKGDTGPQGPDGDTTAADAAAKAAEAAAQAAKTAAEASAGSAASAAESVAGLANDLTALKTENTALKASTARTARSLDYLWKKSKGIVYDTETVTGAGSSVTVPSGAMDYAALRKVGGMSRKGRNLLDITRYTEATKPSDRITTKVDSNAIIFNVPVINGSWQALRITLSDIGSGTYVVTANIDSTDADFTPSMAIYKYDGGTPTYIDGLTASGAKTVTIPDGSLMRLSFHATTDSGAKVPRTVKYTNVMISKTAVAYEPYTNSLLDAQVDAVRVANVAGDNTNTYPIPQAIRDLCPDYGQGTAESYNYIDFAGKAYYHVGNMAQDGTWTALATPEVIDLSAVWPDDFGVLRVEAGGTINLHYPSLDDGFELAVPSETEIMVDVAKVVQTNG